MVDDTRLGERLQAARRAIGLTQTEAGKQLDMVTSTVSAIEAGKRTVTGTELYELARIYKRPLSYFLGDEPVGDAPGFQYLFRQVNDRVEDRANMVLLQQLADDYRLVEELVGAEPLPIPPDYSGFDLRTVEDAESLADMERSRLGLGNGPIKDLAELLDAGVGIRTFLLPVENQRWSGVTALDRAGRPCIAVNSREESYRRNYDLAHEYGHVLVHVGRGGRPEGHIDFRTGPDERPSADERFVDAFAAAFLMPRRAVLQQVERTMRASGGKFTDHDLVHLAMHFGVSGQAMSLRLVSLRKLPRKVHDELWKRERTFKPLAEMLGYQVDDSPSIVDLPVVLPKRFRYLALKAYEREIISVSKLAELLREDVFAVRDKLEATDAVPEAAGYEA